MKLLQNNPETTLMNDDNLFSDIEPREINKQNSYQLVKKQYIQQVALPIKKQNIIFDYAHLNQQTKQQLKTIQRPVYQSVYRADIDGLRTIAISTVVIFHAWPEFMTGGFFGVDVFFVISGYLISQVIIKQVKKDKFSYIDFYSRRIKRIYPALIFVSTLCFIYGCCNLFSERLSAFTRTIGYSAVFGANLHFIFSKQNYFSPLVKENPFLHLWSLGVEEQFYIVWPMFITIIIKCFEKKAIHLMYGFTVVSFIIGLILVYYYPEFAFYFPIGRFWQMSIGGILAYHNFKIKLNIWANIWSSIGFLGIFIIIWVVNQDDNIPGWLALVPTLGAAFILLAGKQAFLNTYILSHPVFVFIGKISYPLYLWHWPLLVFSRLNYPSGSNSILSNAFFIVFLSVILSIITFYFIQNKIRHRKSRLVALVLFILMFLIGASTFAISFRPELFTLKYKFEKSMFQNDMLPTLSDTYIKSGKNRVNSAINSKRLQPQQQRIYSSLFSHEKIPQQFHIQPQSAYFNGVGGCGQFQTVLNEGKSKRLFLMGDSHSQFTLLRFIQLYQESVSKNTSDTYPTVVAWSYSGFPILPCSPVHSCSMNFIKTQIPQRVLFVNHWWRHLRFTDANGPYHSSQKCHHGFGSMSTQGQSLLDVQTDIKQLSQSMKQLVNLGIQVYVVGLHFDLDSWNPQKMTDDNGVIINNLKPIRYSEWRNQNKIVIDLFQNSLKNVGVKIVDFSQSYCWQDFCYSTIPSGNPIFFDSNHYAGFYARHWNSAVDFLTEFP